MDTMWMAPALSDFTAKTWGDLTDAEKREIAAHFAYAKNMPPESFGDLSLPHHRASDGAVVFRGVAAAAGRLNQMSIPSGDMAAVKAHLRAHYEQFGQEMPEMLRNEDDGLTARPYPNEHACRLADPATFDRFRRESRQHEGKSYSVIYGHPKGGGGWQEQAYRYPTGSWTAAQARSHCSGHQGSFEASSSRVEDAPGSLMMPTLYLRADVRPESVNAEARTVEAVFSTGAPVRRGGFFSEPYVETLSLHPNHVRLDRLNAGAPVLNAHSSRDLADIIGVVVPGSAVIRDGKGVAAIRFSRRADVEPIWQDVRDGVVRNISVGYYVHKYEQSEATATSPMRRHAIDWEPYEISAVPMPADAAAQIRAGDASATNPCVIIPRTVEGRLSMDDETRAVPTDPQLMDPAAPLLVPDHPAAQDRATEPTERDAGADLERDRITGILRACRAARLPMSFADRLIADKMPLVEAQKRVFETLDANGGVDKGPRPGPSGVQFTGPDPLENVWRGITNAILHRSAPEYFKLEDIGRPYRSRSLLAAAELCLHHRGIRTAELSKMELAGMAFGFSVRGMHTTSDFANILADATNKILLAAYAEAPQTFEPIARRIPVSDFKPVNLTQFGEAPALLEVLEHGEFKRGTIGDGKEVFTLGTWGRMFSITRKALINDDLNAFARVPIEFGRSARRKESDLVWAELTQNAAMSDGNLLFSTAHANYTTSSGTAISETSLGVGRAKIRIQKGLDGEAPLNLAPRFLIVPTTKETIADQYVTVITPAQGSQVNPFAGRLTVICEPRLDANSTTGWYLACSTDQIDMIVYGYLDGQDGPVVENRVGWEVDGLEVKCRHDVAAKVVDYRGLYYNTGA